MTNEAVHAVFFKHYSGGDLNEALIAASEEISLAILAEQAGPGETLPDIVKIIVGGRIQIGLFMPMFMNNNTMPSVPMSYIVQFDHVRKAMLDTVNYMLKNYNDVQALFKEWFTIEDLKSISATIAEAIEKPSGLPANMRGVNFDELRLEEIFFNKALIGILGPERFKKYADEHNNGIKVLRQCQAECKALQAMPNTKNLRPQ